MMISTSLIIDSCKNRNNDSISVKCRLGNIDPSWRFCSTKRTVFASKSSVRTAKPTATPSTTRRALAELDRQCRRVLRGPSPTVRRSACGPPKRNAQTADQPVFWRPAATPETVQRIR